ncbi:hypothetical protein ROZALSC1DRAFT_22959, partial [Rozella allomycis CSF55]
LQRRQIASLVIHIFHLVVRRRTGSRSSVSLCRKALSALAFGSLAIAITVPGSTFLIFNIIDTERQTFRGHVLTLYTKTKNGDLIAQEFVNLCKQKAAVDVFNTNELMQR